MSTTGSPASTTELEFVFAFSTIFCDSSGFVFAASSLVVCGNSFETESSVFLALSIVSVSLSVTDLSLTSVSDFFSMILLSLFNQVRPNCPVILSNFFAASRKSCTALDMLLLELMSFLEFVIVFATVMLESHGSLSLAGFGGVLSSFLVGVFRNWGV